MMKLNRKIWSVFLFFFIINFVSEFSYGSIFNISGYYKSFFTLILNKSVKSPDGMVDPPEFGLVTNNLRLKSSIKISSDIKLNIAYDVFPSITYNADDSQSFLLDSFQPSSYRIGDLKRILYPGGLVEEGNFTLNHNLDRFSLSIRSDFADFFIGRQSISWGSGRVFNPTDILAPYNFNQLDKEEKIGIDAVRMRIPVGEMNEIDAGYVFGDKFEFIKSAFFIRGRLNILKSDISLLAVGFRGNFLLGFDISSSIGGAGVWVESAFVRTGFFLNEPEKSEENYFRISAGADYNFKGNLYIFVEYYFNSAGSSLPENYIGLFNTIPFKEGNVYQMGRNYVSIGLNKQLHPLVGLNSIFIYNIGDNSLIFSPVLEYNISENIYISLGGFAGFGKCPEIKSVSNENISNAILRSEFGSYPTIIYSSFRIYF